MPLKDTEKTCMTILGHTGKTKSLKLFAREYLSAESVSIKPAFLPYRECGRDH